MLERRCDEYDFLVVSATVSDLKRLTWASNVATSAPGDETGKQIKTKLPVKCNISLYQ